VKLDAHGIELEVPHGWSGRVFSRQNGAATLHAGNYTLAIDDGEFGDRSTGRMRPGACFLALTEYVPGAGLEAGAGLFAHSRIGLPLDPTRFAARALAHPRPGQAGAQQFFTLAGRPLCLYVVLAGGRAFRPRQLAEVNHVLRSLQVRARGTG
jgi:hypothetical protein